MPDAIQPAGWDNWGKPENEKTARYAELNSTGPGARPTERVSWSRQLTKLQSSTITIQHALGGWDPQLTLSPERIAALPDNQRKAWEEYIDRSSQLLRVDKATLATEVKAAGLTAPLPPKSTFDFKLPSKPTLAWFSSPEAKQMADTVISFQIPSGGWSKHTDMHGAQKWTARLRLQASK